MLSEQVKKLLTHEEDAEIEFKETISKELVDTMVAMANAKGGFILIGVRDSEDQDGKQIGEIIGITISDENKRKILNKAQSIIDKLFPFPIIKDETDEKGRSIYIVEIPEGTRKPYCTQGGRYLIRADGNNTSITPGMMEDFIIERIEKLMRKPEGPKEELESTFAAFHSEFAQFVRRFRDEWSAERDTQPPTIDDAKYILESAFQEVLDFKSQIVKVQGTNLSEMLGDVLKGIKTLLQHRVYMDGGRSYRQFWEGGDQILQLLEMAAGEMERIETELAKPGGEKNSSENEKDS